jgi:hypothetical protein
MIPEGIIPICEMKDIIPAPKVVTATKPKRETKTKSNRNEVMLSQGVNKKHSWIENVVMYL